MDTASSPSRAGTHAMRMRLPSGLGGIRFFVRAGLLLATLSLVPAAPSMAADWNQALTTYAENPFRNRRALLRLRREDTHELPPLYLLALGEAALRARRYDAAGRQFEAAIDRGVGEPWVGWAHVGLAWIALAREQYPEARQQFEAVVGTPASPSAGLARFAMALLDAAADEPGTAAQFEAVAADEQAAPDIRRAARLGLAYAAYWQEDYARAAAAFEAFAVSPDVGTLFDDARYAAAWARLRAGEREAAETALATLAAGPGGRGTAPRALVNLEPQAIMRAGFERYRRGPLAAPEQHLARVLDGDGYALAAAALRGFGSDDDRLPPAPLTYVRARLRDDLDGERVVSRNAKQPPAAPRTPQPVRQHERPRTSSLLLAAASAIVLLGLALWLWHATGRPPRRGSR